MTAVCATCTSWAITTSPLRAAAMAPCVHLPRWECYPPTHACARYSALEPVLFAKREQWLEKLMKKHQGVTK